MGIDAIEITSRVVQSYIRGLSPFIQHLIVHDDVMAAQLINLSKPHALRFFHGELATLRARS
jgi:hypothetical protein